MRERHLSDITWSHHPSRRYGMPRRQSLRRVLATGFLTVAAVLLLTLTATGRDGPVLTSDDFFHDIGDYYRSWSNDLNVSVSGLLGSAGGPQTWDFTSGPTDEIKRFDYVLTDDGDDPGAGFYAADHFPDADFAQRMTEEIGSDQAWMYLDQVASVERTNYGYYWPDGNSETNDWSVFTPSILDFPDPLEWGDSWLLQTSYQFQMYDSGVLDVRVDVTIDADVDAWGTVLLPSLGPVEALRVNTEQTSAIYVWLAEQWIPIGTQYTRIYDWVGVGSDIIVEIGSVVSETSMPPDDFTIASNLVRQFENSNPTALPVIADIPDTTLLATYVEFTYDVEASGIPDPTFSLLTAPDGMTIDGVTGLIEWTPTSAQVGRDTVVVQADNIEGTDTETFVATIVNLNEPHSLASTRGDRCAEMRSELEGFEEGLVIYTHEEFGITMDEETLKKLESLGYIN